MVRNKAEYLECSHLVPEQWILLLVSPEEWGLCVAEENAQTCAFDRALGTVSYWLVGLVFFVEQDGNHGDKQG